MSPLLSDELKVDFSCDQVELVRIGRKLTLKGLDYSVLEKRIISCASDSAPIWSNAIDALEAALPGLQKKPAFARVVLSNQFMRYALVDSDPTINNESEEVSYARHRIEQIYGASANSMALKVNQSFAGGPLLVCAVDELLLEAIRELFKRAGVKLKSVQPALMAAYNNHHTEFAKQDAWFVQYEHGNLCLGWVQQGHLSSVRTIKVGNDWIEKLPGILDRETYLVETETSSDRIFLWSHEHANIGMTTRGRWKITNLQPAM